MSPKELYHVAMPTVCSEEECAKDYASLQNCKVQFFRNIINSDIWTDITSDSLVPVSVMLLLENCDTIDQRMEIKRFYVPPKHCKQRTLRIVTCCHSQTSGEPETSTDTPTFRAPSSRLWVKIKPDLKGFQSCNESV